MIENTFDLHSVTLFISRYIFYVLLAVLAINMVQRRHQQQTQNKRLATFYLGLLILAFMVGTIIIVYFSLPDLLIFPLAAGLILLGYLKREAVFPFRLSCSSCGQRLSGKRILFFDSNTCEGCEQSERRARSDESARRAGSEGEESGPRGDTSGQD